MIEVRHLEVTVEACRHTWGHKHTEFSQYLRKGGRLGTRLALLLCDESH